ncbi:hypothetical protein [Caudoviricetes sp.]|nr:hypothetical protein [Caudoviricetes sp.]
MYSSFLICITKSTIYSSFVTNCLLYLASY